MKTWQRFEISVDPDLIEKLLERIESKFIDAKLEELIKAYLDEQETTS